GPYAVLDAPPADRVRRDRHPPLVRFVHGSLHLFRCEGCEVHRHARREHPACGHDLDGSGAALEQLTNGLSHPVWTVRLPCERIPPVASRDGERLAGRNHTRPPGPAVGDGLSHLAHHRPDPAEVSNRGVAGRVLTVTVSNSLYVCVVLRHL